MTTDTEKQFAGNYVRLVNQCRDLQVSLNTMTEAFDNSTQLNNKLHDEIRLKDKMINLMAECETKNAFFDHPSYGKNFKENVETVIYNFKNDALKQLVAEQNKKAANCESI